MNARMNDGRQPLTRRRLHQLATLLAFGAGACGSASTGSQGSAPAPGGKGGVKDTGPIRVQQWDAPNTPFGLWLQGYFQAFPQQTGIQIEIVPRKSDVSAAQEQAVWVAAGDVPDVFFRTGRGLVPYATFASKGIIRPLDPFIKRDRWDQSDFWPNLIKLVYGHTADMRYPDAAILQGAVEHSRCCRSGGKACHCQRRLVGKEKCLPLGRKAT